MSNTSEVTVKVSSEPTTVIPVTVTLLSGDDNSHSEQARQIAVLHNELGTLAKSALLKAVKIGQLLTQVKASLKHGEWLPWIEANLPFTDQTARNYIGVYEIREELNSKQVWDLTSAYKLLAAPKRTIKSTPPKPKELAPAVEVSVETVDVMFKCEEGASIALENADEPTLDSDTGGESFESIVNAIHQQIQALGKIMTTKQNADNRVDAIAGLIEDLEALL